jgi:hypothetical protein
MVWPGGDGGQARPVVIRSSLEPSPHDAVFTPWPSSWQRHPRAASATTSRCRARGRHRSVRPARISAARSGWRAQSWRGRGGTGVAALMCGPRYTWLPIWSGCGEDATSGASGRLRPAARGGVAAAVRGRGPTLQRARVRAQRARAGAGASPPGSEPRPAVPSPPTSIAEGANRACDL